MQLTAQFRYFKKQLKQLRHYYKTLCYKPLCGKNPTNSIAPEPSVDG